MNIADQKFLEQLRDLPTAYLLDLLVDHEEGDKESIAWVLRERGMPQEEIEQRVARRKNSNWPRPHVFWAAARWLTFLNAAIVAYFDITGIYRLLHDDHAFREPLLFLIIGSLAFGFYLGLKLTTHIYLGEKTRLHCGFPFQVGFVDLETGKEITRGKATMTIAMALNALIGISMTLFPLIFIYFMMA
jgi:hypothetical protein